MNAPGEEGNGIITRVAVLEAAYLVLRGELSDLKSEDLREIKDEVRAIRKDLIDSRRGMTRSEKIALAAVCITFIMALLGAAALILQAGGPTA